MGQVGEVSLCFEWLHHLDHSTLCGCLQKHTKSVALLQHKGFALPSNLGLLTTTGLGVASCIILT